MKSKKISVVHVFFTVLFFVLFLEIIVLVCRLLLTMFVQIFIRWIVGLNSGADFKSSVFYVEKF
jgi:hypothetical protein